MPASDLPGTQGAAGGGRAEVRLEQAYASPRADVWQALTDASILSRWSYQLIDYGGSRLDFTEGADLLFVAKDSHLLPALPGRVIRAEAPRLLEYTMAAQALRWQLTARGSGCQLVLTITADLPGSLTASTPYWQAALDALGEELAGHAPG